MGLRDDAEETVRVGLWDKPQPVLADAWELARRIGYARGQIAEAMGFIEGTTNSGGYWAYKALVRARDMLERGS